MKDHTQAIQLFLNQYERRFNEALNGRVDAQATADAFADCFIEANPFSVTCGKNDDHFLEAIPRGVDFYKRIGTRAVRILSAETSMLDDFHAMSKVHWKATYETEDGRKEEIDFDVIYFLQLINDQIKIFAYVTGDEQGALRQKGLLPG